VGPFFRLLDIFCYSSSSSLSFVGISQCCESDVCLHPIVDLPISNQRGTVGNFSPPKLAPQLRRALPTSSHLQIICAPLSKTQGRKTTSLKHPATSPATSKRHDPGEGREAQMSAIWNASEPNGGDSVYDAASMNAQYSGGDIAYVLFSAIDVWIMIPGVGFVSP
jgi:hypothetical protein